MLNIKKTDKLTSLVRILAAQTGSLVNISNLSSTIGVAVETTNDYLYYLEKTYIIQKVTPFYRNISKELTKMYTIYFRDLGLKNYSLGQFGHATQSIPSNGFS